jgi:hypothetical protein
MEKGEYCGACNKYVKDAVVFGADSSDGEYGCACFCEHCITQMISEFKSTARAMLAQPEGKANKPDAAEGGVGDDGDNVDKQGGVQC